MIGVCTGHRVLLFSQMTRALDLIGDTLQALQLPFLRLDGSTKTEQRATMLTVRDKLKKQSGCGSVNGLLR